MPARLVEDDTMVGCALRQGLAPFKASRLQGSRAPRHRAIADADGAALNLGEPAQAAGLAVGLASAVAA
jgi:hypothetical protein